MSLDPITYALVRNSFRAVAREIFTVFKRTAMLPVLYESNDFGISIYDDKLNLIADAPGVPIFIGSLDYAIRRTIDELGGADQLNPGDVLFNNHPFLTGAAAGRRDDPADLPSREADRVHRDPGAPG